MAEMNRVRNNVLALRWRAQAAKKERCQQRNFINLNNLYLSVQRGEAQLSLHVANQLWRYSRSAYNRGDPMLEYWDREFLELPNGENYF